MRSLKPGPSLAAALLSIGALATLLLVWSLTSSAAAASSSGDAASEPQSILAGRDGVLWRTTFVLGNHLVEELPSGCARIFKLGTIPRFIATL
jgi:hypothetical protein